MECVQMLTVCHNGVHHKVPCGKCGFCLQSKRSQWIFRVTHEMRTQENPGFFLTLTYDQQHVPRLSDGRHTLRFRDIQLMLKSLRKAGYTCKYICVGEYGPQTQRPHYHMILWTSCPAEKIQSFWKSSRTGKVRGNIQFGTLEVASAMYCMKYILQPKPRDEKMRGGPRERERVRAQFSKGIGLGYLTRKMYHYHHPADPVLDPECTFTTWLDGQKLALPRYYKQKIFTKYQLSKERERILDERELQRAEEFSRLAARGVDQPKAYTQALRVELARRIIQKSKYGQYV